MGISNGFSRIDMRLVGTTQNITGNFQAS